MQNVLKVERMHGSFFNTGLQKIIIVCIIVCGHIFVSNTTFASELTVPNTFVSGEVASASDMNDNFSAVETAVDSLALSVIERSDEFACPAGSSCEYFVACEPGEVLTGGGFDLTEAGVGKVELWGSKPDIGNNRWRVTTMNLESVTVNYSIYAMCATITN